MTPRQEPVRVGVTVTCATCGYTKKPRGRSEPLGTYYCIPLWDGHGCPGYYDEPRPGSLWPGERSDEFGYPVGPDGTKEIVNG